MPHQILKPGYGPAWRHRFTQACRRLARPRHQTKVCSSARCQGRRPLLWRTLSVDCDKRSDAAWTSPVWHRASSSPGRGRAWSREPRRRLLPVWSGLGCNLLGRPPWCKCSVEEANGGDCQCAAEKKRNKNISIVTNVNNLKNMLTFIHLQSLSENLHLSHETWKKTRSRRNNSEKDCNSLATFPWT